MMGWQWYWLFWNKGIAGYNMVHKYENSRTWKVQICGQKKRCSSKMQPRLQAEWVVLRRQFCILASCCLQPVVVDNYQWHQQCHHDIKSTSASAVSYISALSWHMYLLYTEPATTQHTITLCKAVTWQDNMVWLTKDASSISFCLPAMFNTCLFQIHVDTCSTADCGNQLSDLRQPPWEHSTTTHTHTHTYVSC